MQVWVVWSHARQAAVLQAVHGRPPVPQAALFVPVLQVSVAESQQPSGQLAGVQTQLPFWHSVPAGQAMQATPRVPQ
ncbi:MAG: hypothetical protein LC708_00135 [Actinobacteria bacterium]|nr:hypothetical protein [Actinomycetota bacterium]